MGIAVIIRSAVAAAKAATGSVQLPVRHRAWIGQDALGDETYAAPHIYSALVQKEPTLSGAGGGQVKLLAIVTFLEPIPPNGYPGRDEPIDPRDEITLDDGRTGPIVKLKGGMLDPGTGLPFMSQIGLGRG